MQKKQDTTWLNSTRSNPSGETLEQHGFDSKTGVCVNPFGQKPAWAIRLAAKIRSRRDIEDAEEAPF